MLFNQFMFDRLYSARFFFEKDGGGAGSGQATGADPATGSDSGAGTADDNSPDDAASAGTDEGDGETPQIESYQALYDSLPEGHRDLIDGEIGGLRTALKSERDGRKEDNATLKKQLRELQKQLEEGTEARTTVDELITARDKATEQLDLETERSEFFLEAHNHGVINLKLAWLAVQEERVNKESEMFDKKGRVDFDSLKEQHPQLFAQEKPAAPTARTRAGAGQGANQTSPKRDMNFIIRREAGRT